MAKNKTEKVIDTTLGAVIYSDGGSRNNYGGYGIHGYTYSDKEPTKGSGNPTQYLTNQGYLAKKDVKEDDKMTYVKPLQYINGYGSFIGNITNNIAELAGATAGLDFAINNDMKYVTIITDSEMVVKGANTWLNNWKKNNWIKSDGLPVANKEWWEALDNNILALKEKGTTVNFKWVKGHSTHVGNQLADKLATLGVINSKEGRSNVELNIEQADGYWKNTVEKSPFITHKRLYFTTRKNTVIHGEYFMGDHGKDDDLLGKRTADGCYSYVVLKTPEPVIEIMRDRQCKFANDLDVIVMGRLDKLFEPNSYHDIMTHGEVCFYTPYPDKLDMNFVDNEPVTKELRPPKLAMRAVQQVNALKGVMLAFIQKQDPNLFDTDITNVIYDVDKGVTKLKPIFVTGFTNLNVDVNYKDNTGNFKDKIDLCMGVDLPERNYLKRMEKLNPKVSVVTWMESDKMFRYITIIEADGDIGCYAGMYSNSKFV